MGAEVASVVEPKQTTAGTGGGVEGRPYSDGRAQGRAVPGADDRRPWCACAKS